MIPVYAHRCLAAGRGTFGTPVYSNWQTDVIYYGIDLVRYIAREFGGKSELDADRESIERVSFWDDLVWGNR